MRAAVPGKSPPSGEVITVVTPLILVIGITVAFGFTAVNARICGISSPDSLSSVACGFIPV